MTKTVKTQSANTLGAVAGLENDLRFDVAHGVDMSRRTLGRMTSRLGSWSHSLQLASGTADPWLSPWNF